MIGLLRFVGVLNAAIWFGAAVFFTFGSGPAFFTPEMKALIPPPYNGAAAQLIIARFFILQYICGSVALLHLLVEWLYTGKPFERFTFAVLVFMFTVGLVGGLWMQPKMKQLHITHYRGATAELREQAGRSFGAWHGVSMLGNLFCMGGLLFYLWRVSSPAVSTRIPGARKLSMGWK